MEHCRATHPEICKYHARDQHKHILKSVERLMESLALTKNFKESRAIIAELQEAEREYDATRHGYRSLLKQFRQALKYSRADQQVGLSERIAAAAKERAKDGEVSVWTAAGSSKETLTSTILSYARDADTVRVPLGKTGCAGIQTMVSGLVAEGYEITGLVLYSLSNDDENLAHLEELETRAVAWLNSEEGGSLYSFLNNVPEQWVDYAGRTLRLTPGTKSGSIVTRSFSFKMPDGREISVIGDKDVN